MRLGIACFAFAASLSGGIACAVPAQAEDTIKIGYIDPLSGGGASIGEFGLKTFQYLADQINAAGGVNGKKIEIIGLDNKLNPQESLVQAQKAADQGIRIITQGNGSSVAHALTDFVSKYNDRNPGKELLYFNYAAVDPALTNEKCSYWHFRWDANSDIKMSALTTFMKSRPNIKKVYLINQDYSFGQSVRKAARAMLTEKRPDIEIVGDEVHPLVKITDFSPYIAKIKASGADTVITGNWGQDIALLIKAAADAGLQTDWYTYYAGGAGGPTAIKQTGLSHRVFSIAEGVPNSEGPDAAKFEADFRAKVGIGVWYPRAVNEMRMLVKAINQAKSDDVKAIAKQLEGMQIETFMGSEGFMRKDDHQFFQDMYISSFGPLDPGAKYDEEGTGWGWKAVGTIKAKDTVLPTTCNMDRPS
ncbi:MAG: branched-chain amino acid ABC transporter substrate-binding protein [Beijerinckiaceae bacterium]